MRGQVVKSQTNQIIVHAVAISLLIIVALFLATRFGLMHCSQVPYWCQGYRTLISIFYGRTYPRVLILSGSEGMGDPALLASLLENKCDIYADRDDVRSITAGNLSDYDVVILEKSRRVSPEVLGMIMDFVAKGGKVLIIGDFGVEAERPDEYLKVREFNEDVNREIERVVNVWDRVDEYGAKYFFGSGFLALNYKGNYCSDGECVVSGSLKVRQDFLTSAMPERIPFSMNFAVVEPSGSSLYGPQRTVAAIYDVPPVYGEEAPFPAIVRIGYRIVYIAFPPEELWKSIDEKLRRGENVTYASAGFIIRNICNWAST